MVSPKQIFFPSDVHTTGFLVTLSINESVVVQPDLLEIFAKYFPFSATVIFCIKMEDCVLEKAAGPVH